MKYSKKLIGEVCYLSPIRVEDAQQFTEWLNDLDVTVNLSITAQMISLENEIEYLKNFNKNGEYIFSIIDRKKDKLIGNAGLQDVNLLHRKATFGIFIGDKKYWNKGYGSDATMLILDYGFNLLNLNNILLNVFDYNVRAIKCYEKCGFKKIGQRREDRIIGGKKHNTIFMDILAKEFKSVYVNKKISQC